MKIASLKMWLLAATLLLALVEGGVNVADGNCNMKGQDAVLEENVETTETLDGCENS